MEHQKQLVRSGSEEGSGRGCSWTLWQRSGWFGLGPKRHKRGKTESKQQVGALVRRVCNHYQLYDSIKYFSGCCLPAGSPRQHTKMFWSVRALICSGRIRESDGAMALARRTNHTPALALRTGTSGTLLVL